MKFFVWLAKLYPLPFRVKGFAEVSNSAFRMTRQELKPGKRQIGSGRKGPGFSG
jgi:hypothetical protein